MFQAVIVDESRAWTISESEWGLKMALASLMRKTAIAGAMAMAAALPAKADWGGLYIGAGIGWQGTEIDWRYSNPQPANCCAPITNDWDAAVASGFIGIQHQWGQVVVGLEASWSGLIEDRSGERPGCIIGDPRPCQTGLNHVFTIGPRLGFAPNHQLLVYVTGGYAAGTIASSLVTFDNTSEYHDGWFIGAGFDWRVHGNWILGLEYRHIELDSKLHCVGGGNCSPNSSPDNRFVEATADSVQVRLSYKWGRTEESAPLK